MPGITAIVLAAGASKRMGQQKLVMPFRGSTILNATIGAATASGADQVVVVTGHDAAIVEASILNDSAIVIRNHYARRGNMSSLMSGIEASPDAEAFVLVAGDMPTIRATDIRRMVDLWKTDHPYAAVTEYTDRISHPFLLSWAAVSDARPHQGEKVLWKLWIESGDERVVRVQAGIPAPVDVNTEEDLGRLGSA